MRVPVRFEAITPAYWPRGAARTDALDRIHGRFRTTWGSIMADLDRELWQAGASDVVVQIDCPAVDIRGDGMPKSDARVRSPGVVLRFTHPSQGPVIYPCDAYVDWWSNFRAIVLTLEALRAVDRYRVATAGQQYAGFRQIASTSGEPGPLSPEAAAEIIAEHSGIESEAILMYQSVRTAAVAKALRAAHPDTGGTAEQFDLVSRAKKALEEAA